MRFYRPGESQYVSQFAQLPLDWMYENIKGMQAEADLAYQQLGAANLNVKHLKSGLRGEEQGQGEEAKALRDEYLTHVGKIKDIMYNDPRSSKVAAAELAKLTNKYENDKRFLDLARNEELYEKDLKALEDYKKSGKGDWKTYGPFQNLTTFEPRDKKTGKMLMYTPETEFAEAQDYEKTLMDGTKDIREDGESWAYLQQYGDIGLQKKEGHSEYISSGKVRDIALSTSAWFFPTKSGQYWLDKTFSNNPELSRYRYEYHVNPEEMKYIAMTDIDGNPVKSVEYKHDKNGKVVKDKKGNPVVENEYDMSVYEYATRKLADEVYALNKGKIHEKTRQSTGVTMYSNELRDERSGANKTYYGFTGATPKGLAVGGGDLGVTVKGLWEADKNTGEVKASTTVVDDVLNYLKSAGIGSYLGLTFGGPIVGSVIALNPTAMFETIQENTGWDLRSHSANSKNATQEEVDKITGIIVSTAKNKQDLNFILNGITIKKNKNGTQDISFSTEANKKVLANINDFALDMTVIRTDLKEGERKAIMNSQFFNANKEGNYALTDAGFNQLMFLTADGKYVNAATVAEAIGAEKWTDLTLSINGRANNANVQGDVNTVKIVNPNTKKSIEVNMYAVQNLIDYGDADANNEATARYFDNELGKWAVSKRDAYAIPIDRKRHMEYMQACDSPLPDDATMNANISRYPSLGLIERDNGKADLVLYNPSDPKGGSTVIKTYNNRKQVEDMSNNHTLGNDVISATSQYFINNRNSK